MTNQADLRCVCVGGKDMLEGFKSYLQLISVKVRATAIVTEAYWPEGANTHSLQAMVTDNQLSRALTLWTVYKAGYRDAQAQAPKGWASVETDHD